MPNQQKIFHLASDLGHQLLATKQKCAVAESCTGGGLSAAITDVAGCSQWFDRGFITYTNDAKEQMLGVSHEIIATYGAVSHETACAMAEGVIMFSQAQISAAITGIAGPTGGRVDKPVGTVWIAWSRGNGKTRSCRYLFLGGRQEVRLQAIQAALEGLLSEI